MTTTPPPTACDSTRLLCWNVCGLNNPARRAAVRAMVDNSRASIVCLQETKLQAISGADVAGLLGPDFASDFADGSSWNLIGVYGPQGDSEKMAFIQELRALASSQGPNWLIFGNFNLIYKVADKNNTLLNRRLMGSFKRALDVLSLKELRLFGKRFTW
ncbi:hypothetical protein BRADI_4g21473v3 [Brachypodium distachyon]|uniref:Endonuclease/exonuclease/phosphatase domain-containing protein n=1 Tax=Brachypodium distachyon TaxID=15368 RepID=A0A2K2CP55_BRADI|nr:hypothetical protein BRADI_4g21473v3 [Brachypodium distachyon]